MKDISVFGMHLKRECSNSAKHLPPALVSGVRLREGNLGGVPCIAADVEATVRPARFAKLAEMVQCALNRPVLFVCGSISAVKRADLTERGLAWAQDSEVFSFPSSPHHAEGTCCARLPRCCQMRLLLLPRELFQGSGSGKPLQKSLPFLARAYRASAITSESLMLYVRASLGGVEGRVFSIQRKTSEELFGVFQPTMAPAVVGRRWYRCESMETVSALDLPISFEERFAGVPRGHALCHFGLYAADSFRPGT